MYLRWSDLFQEDFVVTNSGLFPNDYHSELASLMIQGPQRCSDIQYGLLWVPLFSFFAHGVFRIRSIRALIDDWNKLVGKKCGVS